MTWLTPWPGNRTLLRSLATHGLAITYGLALHSKGDTEPMVGAVAMLGAVAMVGGSDRPWAGLADLVRLVQGVGKGVVLFEIADESRQGGAGLAVEGFVKLGAYGAWFKVELNGWLSHAVADRDEAGSRVDYA